MRLKLKERSKRLFNVRKFDVHTIAILLFCINLPLAFIAAIIIIVVMGDFWSKIINGEVHSFNNSFNTQPLGLMLFLSGCLAEFFYCIQITYRKYAENKLLWLYSMAVQIMFITFYLYVYLENNRLYLSSKNNSLIILMIYPGVFLILSYIAYLKLNKKE